MPFKKGHIGYMSRLGKKNKPGVGFQKGHKFLGDLSKPNYFQKGQFKDEKHRLWKGDGVGRVGLHKWVERNLGKPLKCEHCGLDKVPEGIKVYFNWANKSREYKRDLTDWISLCIPCHRKYDKGHITKRFKK